MNGGCAIRCRVSFGIGSAGNGTVAWGAHWLTALTHQSLQYRQLGLPSPVSSWSTCSHAHIHANEKREEKHTLPLTHTLFAAFSHGIKILLPTRGVSSREREGKELQSLRKRDFKQRINCTLSG